MNAIPIDRARPCVGQVPMPDLVGVLRQRNAFEFLLAFLVEKAELDLGRVR
jgi:hypothetical protein